MTAPAHDGSKITDRDKTTESVRAEEGDPALGAFLDFVEADIKTHPEHLRAFDVALHDRVEELVGNLEVDLEESPSGEDQ